jgi:hypothetical protein
MAPHHPALRQVVKAMAGVAGALRSALLDLQGVTMRNWFRPRKSHAELWGAIRKLEARLGLAEVRLRLSRERILGLERKLAAHLVPQPSLNMRAGRPVRKGGEIIVKINDLPAITTEEGILLAFDPKSAGGTEVSVDGPIKVTIPEGSEIQVIWQDPLHPWVVSGSKEEENVDIIFEADGRKGPEQVLFQEIARCQVVAPDATTFGLTVGTPVLKSQIPVLQPQPATEPADETAPATDAGTPSSAAVGA